MPGPELSSLELALLEQAVAVARAARGRGDHPFGAVVADSAGNVVTQAANTVVSAADPTGHAELNAIRRVGALSGVLAGCTLYTSTEPCAMCAGGIYWAGVGRVVYALAETELQTFTGTDARNPTMALACRAVFAAGSQRVEVIGPVDMPSAREVHAGFWSG
jgi:tRNA(Arg) A34 adenosine deaminase TadA